MRTVTQLGGCADSEQNSRSLWREGGSLADRDEDRAEKGWRAESLGRQRGRRRHGCRSLGGAHTWWHIGGDDWKQGGWMDGHLG